LFGLAEVDLSSVALAEEDAFLLGCLFMLTFVSLSKTRSRFLASRSGFY
jgi:hypothetical protein